MKIYISVLKSRVHHKLTQGIRQRKIICNEENFPYLITLRAKQEQNLQDSNIPETIPMLQYNIQCLCCYTTINVHVAIKEPMPMLLYKNQCSCCDVRNNAHVAIKDPMCVLLYKQPLTILL